MDYIIGGLAGAGATIVTNPMDVVKTRLQLQGELKSKAEQTKRYRGIFHAFYVIAKNDGVMALQKGLAPAMLFGFTMNSVRLGLYHVADVQGWTKTKDGGTTLHKAMFWSCVSGVLSGVASNPASVLKTRIQASAHPSIAVGRQHVYNGMLDGFKTIYRREGMRGYFAGVTAACTRLAIGSTAQLTTFAKTKEWLVSQGVIQSPLGLAFGASAMSGIVVAVFICPMDVIAVRLFNQGSSNLLYTGVMDCFAKTYKTEGLYGFYKGIGPLYLRMAPHTTLSLIIWDMLNNVMKNKKNS